jgi:hypothetical protein
MQGGALSYQVSSLLDPAINDLQLNQPPTTQTTPPFFFTIENLTATPITLSVVITKFGD